MLAADLVNTAPGRAATADALGDVPILERFLDEHEVLPRRPAVPADLVAIRALRPRLLAAWEAAAGAATEPTDPAVKTAVEPMPPPAAEAAAGAPSGTPGAAGLVSEAAGLPQLAAVINELLDDSGARPYLTDHGGGWGWHLHVTKPDAPLVDRVAAQVAFAFADLVRLGETERLRRCAAPGCQAVLVDLSRNRSRLYCDTGNCGNRQHVAAYRARRALSRSVAGG